MSQLPELPEPYTNEDSPYHAGEGRGLFTDYQMHAFYAQAIASVKPNQFKDTATFKNFHRRLCERFGYVHDEQDWWRDLCSIEEHIAASVKRGPLSVAKCCEIWTALSKRSLTEDSLAYNFARAIEQAHGITKES